MPGLALSQGPQSVSIVGIGANCSPCGDRERAAVQTIEKSAVLVPHHHDAIPPAVEAIVKRCRVAPHEAGVGVVDEHAVGVADDTVGHEEPAVGMAPPSYLPRTQASTRSSSWREPALRRDSSTQCEQAGLTSVSNISGRKSDTGWSPSAGPPAKAASMRADRKHR